LQHYDYGYNGYFKKLKAYAGDLFLLINEIEVAEAERKAAFRVVYINGEKQEQDFSAKFTDKEVNKMPKEFKKDFKAGKVTAHARRRPNGSYEVRCQYKGKKITASAKTLTEAKERFIEKLQTPESGEKFDKTVKFSTYLDKWLKTAKEPFVKPNTFKNYILATADVRNAFGDRSLASITQTQLQSYYNADHGQANISFTLIKSLFDNAVGDSIIAKSPMTNVRLARKEQTHGQALTRAEERVFIEQFKKRSTVFRQAAVVALYTGLRRSEIITARLDGKWIVAECAKQRKGAKVKTRKIPVSPMLERLLPLVDFDRIRELSISSLTSVIRRCIPGHHLHELRHTFITRCQECGIRREIVSLWAGHAADNSITSTVYTHLENNEDIQLVEIAKFNYEL